MEEHEAPVPLVTYVNNILHSMFPMTTLTLVLKLLIVCIALKDDYHDNRMDKLAYTPVDFINLETPANTFNIPARQNQFIQGNILNNAPFRRIAVPNEPTLHSLDLTQKNPSCINYSISDNLEDSEVIRRL